MAASKGPWMNWIIWIFSVWVQAKYWDWNSIVHILGWLLMGWDGDRKHNVMLVFLLPLESVPASADKEDRDPAHGSYFVGYCKAHFSLPFNLTSTYSHWVRWSDSLGWGINMLMKNPALHFHPGLPEWYCECPCDQPYRPGVWMEHNELRLNPSKTDGFGCLGLPVPRFFYFWYWMGGGTASDGPDAKSRCPFGFRKASGSRS